MQSAEIYNPFDVIALEIYITLILPARKTIFNNREKVQNVFKKKVVTGQVRMLPKRIFRYFLLAVGCVCIFV